MCTANGLLVGLIALFSPLLHLTGRRRKRTRKEMEAARQKESEQSASVSGSALNDLDLMQAVTSQIAYIDDRGGTDELKVYYVSGASGTS